MVLRIPEVHLLNICYFSYAYIASVEERHYNPELFY